MKVQKYILYIVKRKKIASKELLCKTDTLALAIQIKRRRWIGHACRMSPGTVTMQRYAGHQIAKGDVVDRKNLGPERSRNERLLPHMEQHQQAGCRLASVALSRGSTMHISTVHAMFIHLYYNYPEVCLSVCLY